MSTNKQLKEIMTIYELSRQETSDLLSVSLHTLRGWLTTEKSRNYRKVNKQILELLQFKLIKKCTDCGTEIFVEDIKSGQSERYTHFSGLTSVGFSSIEIFLCSCCMKKQLEMTKGKSYCTLVSIDPKKLYVQKKL